MYHLVPKSESFENTIGIYLAELKRHLMLLTNILTWQPIIGRFLLLVLKKSIFISFKSSNKMDLRKVNGGMASPVKLLFSPKCFWTISSCNQSRHCSSSLSQSGDTRLGYRVGRCLVQWSRQSSWSSFETCISSDRPCHLSARSTRLISTGTVMDLAPDLLTVILRCQDQLLLPFARGKVKDWIALQLNHNTLVK
jgi:hypothetical protein